jgi:hypothetical protein
MEDLTYLENDSKPPIDAADLIRAKKSSPARFERLFNRYKNQGFSTAEIVAAMAASPLLVDAIGRGRPAYTQFRISRRG